MHASRTPPLGSFSDSLFFPFLSSRPFPTLLPSGAELIAPTYTHPDPISLHEPRAPHPRSAGLTSAA